MVPNLQKLSINTGIPDVVLPSAAVEMSKSVANVALDRLSSVQDRASASAIPSAAVDISKSLATAVAAGTNVATETGTRAISSLFGRLGGVMSMASASPSLPEESTLSDEDDNNLVEEKMENEVTKESELECSFHKKPIKVKIDSFYELIINDKDVYPNTSTEKTIFEDFSSNSSLGLDPDLLNSISSYYRSSIESDDNDEIKWKTLQDIILKINNEDAVLGTSLILSEIINKHNKFESIEEIVEENQTCTPEIKEDESTDMHENDGWEDDWSDPDLSGLSEEEDSNKKQIDKTVTRIVNVAKHLVESLVHYKNDDKKSRTELALYVISLALVLEKQEITPEVAFKLPSKAVMAIANKYRNSQLKCDSESHNSKTENDCDYNLIDLFSEVIQETKSIYQETL